MFRRTAQWIAYFIIVIALVCGLEVIGNLPVQSQSSLPLGTHLWLVLLVCARFDDSNIRVVFQNLSAGVHRLHDGHLHLGLAHTRLEVFTYLPGRSVLRLDCGYRQQYTQRHLAHRIVVRMVAQ